MKKDIVLLLLAIIVSFSLQFLYQKASAEKNAYVNVKTLYNEFDMKKDLESNFMNVGKIRQAQLDSMELELKLMNRKMEESPMDGKLVDIFETKKETFFMRKQQFEEDNARLQNTYSTDIMKQLNQYVADYGKENNYTYIYGAEGSGTLMYAAEVKDITTEVKNYINQKYKGKIR